MRDVKEIPLEEMEVITPDGDIFIYKKGVLSGDWKKIGQEPPPNLDEILKMFMNGHEIHVDGVAVFTRTDDEFDMYP